MISHFKKKCTKCGDSLDNGNRYISSNNTRYNQCIRCKRIQLNGYAKRRAERKRQAGKWFFESEKLGK